MARRRYVRLPLYIDDEVEPVPTYQRQQLNEEAILDAARRFIARVGRPPSCVSGDATQDFAHRRREDWRGVDVALRLGFRGLPGGTTLSELLRRHQIGMNAYGIHGLTEENIVMAAKKHHARTGWWPRHSEKLKDATEDFGFKVTWDTVRLALAKGTHRLPGRDTLDGLLQRTLGEDFVPTRLTLQLQRRLTEQQVLDAARAHLERTGRRPTIAGDGAALSFGFEITWRDVENALRIGLRGLPGGSTLKRFLDAHNVPTS